MWESKDHCIDINYNTDHVWFDGINGQHMQKPADIRKWEESKCYLQAHREELPSRQGR